MPKFPHYEQLDAMDCGPSCLRMVAKFYGKTYSLQYLHSRSYITREGVSMWGISDAAESIGFRTEGYRLAWEQLTISFRNVKHNQNVYWRNIDAHIEY